jgi:cytochrome P450
MFEKKSLAYFDTLMKQILKERKNNPNTSRNDFVQLLMSAEAKEGVETLEMKLEEDANEGKSEPKSCQMPGSGKISRLTTQEIVDQGFLFLLAGYDTTSNTLTHLAYSLALHPHVQDRLLHEIDTLVSDGKQDDYEAVTGLKYLEAVIMETLRFYPTIPRVDRLAIEDCYLGNIFVPKNTPIVISVYNMHHDPEYFEEPEIYDPERFLPENKSRHHPYAFVPFAAGPRNCVGMRFAMYEMKLCLVKILSQYRFEKSHQTKVPLEYYSGQAVMAPIDVKLSIIPRKDLCNNNQ